MTTEVDGMTDEMKLLEEETTLEGQVDETPVDQVDEEASVQEEEKPTAEGEKVEEPKAEAKKDDDAKRWRDTATAVNGQLAILARGYKKLIEDGLVTYDEVANEIGTDPKTIQNIVEGKGTPYDVKVKQFNEKLNAVKGLLVKQYGSIEAVNERVQAYDWLIKNDAQAMDEFMSAGSDTLLDGFFSKEDDIVEDFRAAQSPRALRQRIKELEALLEGKKPEAPVSQPQAKQPLAGGLSAAPKKTVAKDPFERLFS